MARATNGEPERQQYVEDVLQSYRNTPGTLGHVRKEDRRLAYQLYDQGIPLVSVEAALILATVRRLTRPENAEPLPPIRSLHYFRPVINEILGNRHIDAAYMSYLRMKYLSLTAKAFAENPQG